MSLLNDGLTTWQSNYVAHMSAGAANARNHTMAAFDDALGIQEAPVTG
jgi:hypothetical protein